MIENRCYRNQPAKEKAERPLDAAACSPREPLRRAYSREELTESMAGWLVNTYGHPMELTEASRDRWMERNGMLYAFICDHFPAENAGAVAPPPQMPDSTNDAPGG